MNFLMIYGLLAFMFGMILFGLNKDKEEIPLILSFIGGLLFIIGVFLNLNS